MPAGGLKLHGSCPRTFRLGLGKTLITRARQRWSHCRKGRRSIFEKGVLRGIRSDSCHQCSCNSFRIALIRLRCEKPMA